MYQSSINFDEGIYRGDFSTASNDHPLPQITIHPQDEVSYVGSNISLKCGANSSLDSEMAFTWKMNNHRLDNVPTKRFASAQNRGVTQISELLLTSMTMSQSGQYQCVVSNGYGVAYSKLSQLSVLGELKAEDAVNGVRTVFLILETFYSIP